MADGAYATMIERLGSQDNPNLMLLHYDARQWSVVDLAVVPKQFFIPEIIEARTPLTAKARRAGWTGCNILLDQGAVSRQDFPDPSRSSAGAAIRIRYLEARRCFCGRVPNRSGGNGCST